MHLPLILMSFGVGVLIGLTSMGGAALMAPFLILVLGVRPTAAVGTDLVYGAITKMVGAWAHWSQGSVDMRAVKRLAMGSIPGGLVGSLAVILMPRVVHDSERVVERAIGVLLVIVALILIARLVLRFRASPRAETLAFLKGPGTVIWGAVVGFCVGATSVGSGSLLAPFLLILFASNSARAVGTDVCHAALLVSVTGMAHVVSGNVEWHLIPWLLAGAIPGVLAGSRIAPRVPETPLRAGLAAILLVTGIRML
ncbi:MAG TPA: sulfite exporter TauE/SafE family protein [Bryobacteraceae bacterium]|nr:sulfite exporter TauE/SafE family protein [Bryobacteraceae bacterium]